MSEKKLVSYCIVTYNASSFIEEALQSAFSQSYDPMEIIICDDCSSDNTFEIIQNTINKYEGEKKIIAVQNPENIGIRENYNKVLYELSHGEYIIFADGDDVSSKNRVEAYVEYFDKYPEIMSISCLSEEVDSNLHSLMPKDFNWTNSFSIFNLDDYIDNPFFIIYSGDSRGIRRDVVNKFPPNKYAISEDLTIFIRSLILGNGCYLRTSYVKRRHHNNNVSSRPMNKQVVNLLSKQLFYDLDYAFKHNYISEYQANRLKKKILLNEKLFLMYYGSPFTNIKTFFYRCLNKLFNVKVYK